jgi:hypothetical protein
VSVYSQCTGILVVLAIPSWQTDPVLINTVT